MSGATAIVTGAGGFLGKTLVQKLIKAGARVVGIDRLPDDSGSLAAGAYHCVDALDFEGLVNALQQHCGGAEDAALVFHLTGRANVGACAADPRDAFLLNVAGTANVLEACRRTGIRRLVFPSSALVYDTPAATTIDEGAPVKPRSIYAATKLAAESMLSGYASAYDFCCTVARLGNVYGEGATEESIVAIVLRQVAAGGPIAVRSLAPVRDFVFRDDVAEGLIALALVDDDPGFTVFNLASGVPTAIRDLVVTACRVADLDTEVVERAPGPDDLRDRIVLSVNRMADRAQWRPAWSLEDGLSAMLSGMKE